MAQSTHPCLLAIWAHLEPFRTSVAVAATPSRAAAPGLERGSEIHASGLWLPRSRLGLLVSGYHIPSASPPQSHNEGVAAFRTGERHRTLCQRGSPRQSRYLTGGSAR